MNIKNKIKQVIVIAAVLLFALTSFANDSYDDEIKSIRTNYYSIKGSWESLNLYQDTIIIDDGVLRKYNVSVHSIKPYLSDSNHYCIIINNANISYEFLIKNSSLYFVFSNEMGRENRYYFNKDIEIIKWIDETKNEYHKSYIEEKQRLLSIITAFNSELFVAKEQYDDEDILQDSYEEYPINTVLDVPAELESSVEDDDGLAFLKNYMWWFIISISLFILLIILGAFSGNKKIVTQEEEEEEEEKKPSKADNFIHTTLKEELKNKNKKIQTYRETIEISIDFIEKYLLEDEKIISILFATNLDNIFFPNLLVVTDVQVYVCELDYPIRANKMKGKKMKSFNINNFMFSSIKSFTYDVQWGDVKLMSKSDEIFGLRIIPDDPDHVPEAKKMVKYVNEQMRGGVTVSKNQKDIDIPKEISKLSELKDSGILSQKEFDVKKKDLLSRL